MPSKRLNQTGYAEAVIVIFAAVFAWAMLVGSSFPKKVDFQSKPLTATCSIMPKQASEIAAPSITGKEKEAQCNGPQTQYALVRVNVPMKMNFFVKEDHTIGCGEQKLADGKTYKLFLPSDIGGLEINGSLPEITKEYGGDGSFNFHKAGIIFLVHTKDGVMETIDFDPKKNGKKYVLTDVYQDTTKTKIPDSLMSCAQGSTEILTQTSSASAFNRGAYYPEQDISVDHKQQQLEYFSFGVEDDTAITKVQFSPHCKPAIYIYPENPTLVNVKIHSKGTLIYTDPVYPSDGSGWNVLANPNGDLEYRDKNSDVKKYGYLYYESRVADNLIKKPDKGYVVPYPKLAETYTEILPRVGLNENQTKDFIEYWNKSLPYSPYYFIGFLDEENINNIESLEITPKPQQIKRVRVYFESLKFPKRVNLPEIKPVSRIKNGLTVSEWGGTVKMEPGSNFTCNQ